MARAAKEGAGDRATLLEAAQVEPADLLEASGYIFASPENLASLSGQMKEMFDRCYYPVLGQLEGRPYATLIAAGSDGEGAQRQLDRIVTGWRLKRVAEPFICNFAAQLPEEILALKIVPQFALSRCRDIGEAMAEGLQQGIF